MRVTLSANAPYYYHTALALQKAGYLDKYINAIGVSRGLCWIYRLLPYYWEQKLRGRDISGINQRRYRSMWLPELLQKGLPLLQIMSADRGNWLNNNLYDVMARRHVEDCDIFHFMTSVGLYSARKAARRGAVIVCDQNTPYPDIERRLIRAEYDELGLEFDPPGLLYDEKVKAEYELADYIVVPSEFVRQSFIEAGYEPDRLFVVPYGAEMATVPSGGCGENEKFRIIFAAQIVPRKGLHYLVQAFEELALPDAELLLVGAANGEMLNFVEKWVNRNPSITAIGSVPRLQLKDHYGRSSVFVLPSVSEGSALGVYDAMASGLPVIVTHNTGSEELVRDGIEGFVIPIRDVEELKDRILRLYRNPGLQREMSAAARDRIKGFSWERYGERLISVYEEIARRERIKA